MTFLKLVDIEIFKLRRRAMTWIVLGVLVLVIVVVYVLLWLVTDQLAAQPGTPGIGGVEITNLDEQRSQLYLEQSVPFGLQIIQIVGTFLVVILAGSAIGSEYDWHTIRPFVTATPSRWHYLGSKLVAIAILTVIGTLIGMVVAVTTSGIISEVAGASDYGFIDGGYLGDSALSYLRTLLTIAPYLGLAVLFGTIGPVHAFGCGVQPGDPVPGGNHHRALAVDRQAGRADFEHLPGDERRNADAGERAAVIAAGGATIDVRVPARFD